MVSTPEAMARPQILDDPFDDPEGHGSIVTWRDMVARQGFISTFVGDGSRFRP